MPRTPPLPLLLLAGLLAVAPQAAAQDPLAALVREGLERNLGLAASRLEARRTALEVPRATAALLPSADVDARWSEFSGVLDLGTLINPAYQTLNQLTGTNAFPTDLSITVPFKQDMRVRVVQPLFVPAAWAGRRAAIAGRDAGAAAYGRDARALGAGIRLAWLRAAAAERQVAIWRATLAVLDENLRVSERLVAAGTATPDAVHRARADRAETVQSLVEAQRDADAARRQLNELVQRPLEAPLDPMPDTALVRRTVAADRTPPSAAEPAEDPLLATGPLPPLDLALATARGQREELTGAAAAERQAAAGVQAAGAAFLPVVALAGDYGFQGNTLRFGNNDFAVASLTLQWNVFRGGADAVRRQQAAIQRDQARLQREATAQAVEREVRDAWAAAVTADTALVAAEQRRVAAARTLVLVTRRYEEGLASPLEFTDARAAWTRAAIGADLARVARTARRVALARAAALD